MCWTGRGRFSGALLVLGIIIFFVGRLLRRRMILKELAAARLEPEELKRQLDAGEPVFIVDLRHPLELLPDPFTLPGARHFSPEALAARHTEIPRDRDIVLFCTCPSEATAAKTAMALHSWASSGCARYVAATTSGSDLAFRWMPSNILDSGAWPR